MIVEEKDTIAEEEMLKTEIENGKEEKEKTERAGERQVEGESPLLSTYQ